MNRLHSYRALILFFSILGLSACSEEEEEPFYFKISTDSCEAPLYQNTYIPIISGNGNYSLEIENNDIIEAQADFSTYTGMPFGVIRILGKQKGETTLSITDKVTEITCDLKVKVTDNYLCYTITESNHPALSKYREVYLINNDTRDAYFFDEEKNNVSPLLTRGNYEFVTQNNTPYLILYYAEKDGQITDAANTPPSAHKFNLRESDSKTFEILKSFLNVDWTTSAQTVRNSGIQLIYLRMQAEDPTQKITGYISRDVIPCGLLE